MLTTRVRFTVEIDLDGVPGWGNTPKDFSDLCLQLLQGSAGHYNPTVSEAVVITDFTVVNRQYEPQFIGDRGNCEKFIEWNGGNLTETTPNLMAAFIKLRAEEFKKLMGAEVD